MRRLLTASALLALLAVPGVQGGDLAAQRVAKPETQSLIPLPFKSEKPFAALSRVILGGRDSLVRAARSQVGARYRLGAMQPGLAFDCSGLVKWVAGLFKADLPRTAAQQAMLGVEVAKDTAQLLPGDFLYFGSRRHITHIGIYVGDGKYVHAARPGKGVIESDLARTRATFWQGARRLFIDADSLVPVIPSLTTVKSEG
jgi:cell wall-associated NlpC family hydrolase